MRLNLKDESDFFDFAFAFLSKNKPLIGYDTAKLLFSLQNLQTDNFFFTNLSNGGISLQAVSND